MMQLVGETDLSDDYDLVDQVTSPPLLRQLSCVRHPQEGT